MLDMKLLTVAQYTCDVRELRELFVGCLTSEEKLRHLLVLRYW